MFTQIGIIKRTLCLVLLVCLAVFVFTGCGKKDPLDPANPLTLTFWHPYTQQMQTVIDELIKEFNETVGAKRGVIVHTDYIADVPVLHEKIRAAINGDPGSPGLPDIAVIYPKIGISLAEAGLLTDLSSLFTPNELAQYIPAFMEEGKLNDGIPYILPIAKSTEVLYVNTTLFDRFAADTGVTLTQLATFEGILDASAKYYDWSGGKDFFHIVDLFNYAMTGYEQLGDKFVTPSGLNLGSPLWPRMWDAYYPPAVRGGVAVFDNYGNYLMATGEIVCALGTSASITYYPSTVIYGDNTEEDCILAILPQPVHEGGQKIALQRGGGLCIIKSNNSKEYAAGLFLKWLTQPDNNLRFTAHTGYMPVTEAAFDGFIAKDLMDKTSANVATLFETIIEMHNEYTFYYPPVFDGFDRLQAAYNQSMRQTATASRREYRGLLNNGANPSSAYDSVSTGVFEKFRAVQ